MGTLDSKGIIDFYIKAGPTTPRGGQMFNEMIYSYGAVFQMTKDQDVVIALRAAKGRLTPVQIARLLNSLFEEGLTQASLLTFFKRAFPEIPLKVLLDTREWSAVSSGDMTDEDINALLQPWLGE